MHNTVSLDVAQPAGRPARPLSILYVEDSEDIRSVVSLMLEGEQREIVSCASGEEALDRLATRRFDIVMTDVSLPGISGTELARHVLAVDPAQWVVLCSGYDLSQGLASLGTQVRSLAKPFEFDELDALLDEITAALGG